MTLVRIHKYSAIEALKLISKAFISLFCCSIFLWLSSQKRTYGLHALTAYGTYVNTVYGWSIFGVKKFQCRHEVNNMSFVI